MMNIDGYGLVEELSAAPLYRLFRVKDGHGRQYLLKKSERGSLYKTALARLHREFETGSNLQLQGLIRPVNLLSYTNHTVLILEDPGYTPLDMILEKGSLRLAVAIRIAAGLAAILADLHQSGYIHRDIKPANLLVDPDSGAVALHGTGISTQIPNSVHGVQGAVFLGISPTYISPELSGRTNRLVDYRTDLYSLGVTLFEMVTGTPPFTSDDHLELIHAHVARQPPSASEISTAVPATLSAIIQKLMAKSAEDRYQGGRGLNIDLLRCLHELEAGGDISAFQLAESDPPSRFELPQRFYGRDEELETLFCSLEDVSQGKLRPVMVSGDPGIGKTTLVQELRKAVFSKNGLFIAGKYEAHNRGTPYSGIREALRDLWQQLLTDEPEQVAEYHKRFKAALGANIGVIIDITPEFSAIVGNAPPLPELEPLESKNRFTLCFQLVLRTLAESKRPLVLFLDDLQWADLSSLELIEGALEKSLGNLLLIGAYRDTNINERHPLMQTLRTIEERGAAINFLHLGPLDMPDIRKLVADSLRISIDRTIPLSDQVFRKTAGNPFFTRAFLITIYEEGFLHPDQQGNWLWDLPKIAELGAVGDLGSLAARIIRKIPDRIRNTISIAAALGHPLDITTLAAACAASEAEVENDLIEACKERILYKNEEAYQFRHDHLKECAYDLIPATDRGAVHLRIGRLLAGQVQQSDQKQRIFATLDHYNRAINLLHDPDERQMVANLNLEAGRIAKSAAAFPAAFKYFSHARTLLPAASWNYHYKLTLEVFTEAAEAAFLTADFREADNMVCQILSNAENVLDRIPAYETQIAVAHARLLENEAIRMTLAVIKLLGVDIPDTPTESEVNAAVADIGRILNGALASKQTAVTTESNPEHLAAMRLLARAAVIVGLLNHPLYLVITHRLIALAIRYPQSAEAPVAYIMAGGVLCYLHDDFLTGGRAGDQGMKLLSHATSRRWQPFCHFLFAVDINCWRKHYFDLVDEFNRAYRIGMDSGDLVTASISAYYASEAGLYAGIDLNQLLSSTRSFYAEAVSIGGKRVSSGLLRLKQLIKALSNGIDPAAQLHDEITSANEAWQAWHVSADQTVLEISLCHEIMAFCIYRHNSKSARTALCIHELPIGGVNGFLPSDYYICLSLLDALATTPEEGRQHLRDIIAAHQKKVSLKASACPVNYQHKLDLVEAQQMRLRGETVKAMELFDRAIEGAREHRYIHDEALACEIAAEFYLGLDRKWVATAYLHSAIAAYEKWNAWGKLDQLHDRYPDLLGQKTDIPASARTAIQSAESTADDSSNFLDVASIEKAAAALSRELELPRLLKMLINILLQNAGAQRGMLLKEDGGKILIEASGSVDDDEVQILLRTPIEKAENLSRSIIRYVSRSHETVVIGNATEDQRFSGTPYIVREKPKSILCAPILHRGKQVGILYLENNLSRDAFSGERLKAIQLISSQAAIALENARLMEGLKLEVRIRKQAEIELRKALAEVDRLKERLHAENTYLKEEILGSHGFDEIVGNSEALRKVLTKVSHVSSTDATVLILGETGTGKELIARAIHNRSLRKESAMVRVNCAALPATLIESELFGHEKGAFTGAIARKLGRFELADGGTIFLDEIGELPLDLQAKLLRILQEGEFERVGSTVTQKINVRVIAATNRDLKEEISAGTFRSDLYYRISVFPIELPPLSSRQEDIPLLAWYFITKKQIGLGKSIKKIPKEVMDALQTYRWPGNIRELENVIERAVILSPGAALSLDESFAVHRPARHPEAVDYNLSDVERNHIISVLEKCGWKVKGKGNAAEQLGLNPSTLSFRIRKLGIERP